MNISELNPWGINTASKYLETVLEYYGEIQSIHFLEAKKIEVKGKIYSYELGYTSGFKYVKKQLLWKIQNVKLPDPITDINIENQSIKPI